MSTAVALEQTASWYDEAFRVFVAGWPNQSRNWSPQQTADFKKLFCATLSKYPRQVPMRAFERLHGIGKFIPSISEITEVLDLVKREWDREQPEKTVPVTHQLEASNHVPHNLADMEAWISAAPNKCERLGRLWQAETKAKGLSPNRVLSREENAQRAKELFKVFEESSK